MKVELIYHTPDYHKLVETTARECYQSWHKMSDSSEGFIRSIMAKGHISIASVGNMVFCIRGFYDVDDVYNSLYDITTLKEINNYIRWSKPNLKKNPQGKLGILLSMNMLTFIDILNKRDDYVLVSDLVDLMKEAADKVPCLAWFYNRSAKIDPKTNQYALKGDPELYNPVVLTSDYEDLKAKGLTDYELDIHATATVNFKTSRDIGLQMWRHADMAGGTELSQRYVSRSDAEFRRLVGFEIGQYPPEDKLQKFASERGIGMDAAKTYFDTLVLDLYNKIDGSIADYTTIRDSLIKLGVRQGRAKEIARALLPNATTTKIIQCRPLRQWKHFIALRNSKHAQAEIEKETKELVRVFEEEGIPI